jgi:hypothetical protein
MRAKSLRFDRDGRAAPRSACVVGGCARSACALHRRPSLEQNPAADLQLTPAAAGGADT